MGIAELEQCSNLVELLGWRAIHQAEKRAFTFLHNGEVELTHLSYRELDRQARAIAAALQGAATIGERALLLYPPGLAFISAFFGCLYAGVVAIPAPLPDQVRLKRTLPRLQALVEDAQASLVLTDFRHADRIAESSALSSLVIRATDRLTDEDACDQLAARWQPPEGSPKGLRFEVGVATLVSS